MTDDKSNVLSVSEIMTDDKSNVLNVFGNHDWRQADDKSNVLSVLEIMADDKSNVVPSGGPIAGITTKRYSIALNDLFVCFLSACHSFAFTLCESPCARATCFIDLIKIQFIS